MTEPLPGPGDVEGTEIGRLFTRIIGDPEFKQLLLDDPDAALEGYDLSPAQKLMVKTLEEEDFDKLSMDNLGEYFSADAAVYTPDESQVADQEAYSEQDFLDLDDEPAAETGTKPGPDAPDASDAPDAKEEPR